MTTQARIRALTKKWVKRFRLDAWDILVRYAPNELDPEHPRFGESRVSPHIYAAEIVIFDPTDLENTVVHELLHILHVHYHGAVPESMDEQHICTLATAFVGTSHKPYWRGGKVLRERR